MCLVTSYIQASYQPPLRRPDNGVLRRALIASLSGLFILLCRLGDVIPSSPLVFDPHLGVVDEPVRLARPRLPLELPQLREDLRLDDLARHGADPRRVVPRRLELEVGLQGLHGLLLVVDAQELVVYAGVARVLAFSRGVELHLAGDVAVALIGLEGCEDVDGEAAGSVYGFL